MRNAPWRWLVPGLVGLGTIGAWVPARAWAGPADDPPPLEGPAGTQTPRGESHTAAPAAPVHEALGPAEARASGVVVAKAPPLPLNETPSPARPADPRAQWIEGYWAWDPAQNDFAWVEGVWRVAPAGSIWVAGHWRRGAEGWTRVPGFWSGRRERPAAAVPARGADRGLVETQARVDDWRATGPPADHPDDTPPPAPGANYFFIPGHYAPAGDRLRWTPGLWARVQPGWDWVPARWVRRPGDWDFRDGYWTREPAAAPGGGLPPAIVDSTPAAPTPGVGAGAGEGVLPNANPDRPRDPIAEAERGQPPTPWPPANDPAGRSLVYPVRPPLPGDYAYRYGMRYRVIRPPGVYPYGPAGVVVPDATPPFVQRLLNRVLP